MLFPLVLTSFYSIASRNPVAEILCSYGSNTLSPKLPPGYCSASESVCTDVYWFLSLFCSYGTKLQISQSEKSHELG